jgi:hypothetical protein
VFFPYHLIGPDEVEHFMRRWLDELGAATNPEGAPDFVDLPDAALHIGNFDVLWSSTAKLTMRIMVDVSWGRPAEPLVLAATFTRGRVAVWRYCRNDNHPEAGRDHLHLDNDTRLVGLPDPLTLSQLTARLLTEPR